MTTTLSPTALVEEVNDALAALGLPSEPEGLYAPVRYVLAGGGKRIRPVLVLLTAEAFGGDAARRRAMGAALRIIDADPQGSAFQWYATSKQRKIEVPGINVIQASDEDNIRKKVVELDNLDAIVIDLPGFADQRLSNAFLDADLVVIPTKISLLDATQVVRTVRYIHDQAGRLKMKPPNYRAVLNEYDAIERNTSAVKEVAAYFSDNKIKICDAVIFKRPTFRAMTNGYGTLYQMKDSDEAVKRARTNSDHVVRELLSAIEGDEQ